MTAVDDRERVHESFQFTGPCEARRDEFRRLHDGSTPTASHVVRWRPTTRCCGHPLPRLAAVPVQLLCPSCVAQLLGSQTYSCRHCGIPRGLTLWDFSLLSVSPLPRWTP